MTAISSPKPVTAFGGDRLPPYLSNGVVGLRVREVPFRSGVATLSGLEGEHPIAGVPGAPFVPYPLAGDLRLAGLWASDAPASMEVHRQAYDFHAGELTTTLTMRHGDISADIEVLTFCSRTQPTLVLQQVTVAVSRDVDIAVAAVVDPTGVPGSWAGRLVEVPEASPDEVDGALAWRTLGGLDTCGVAYATELVAAGDVRKSTAPDRDRPLRTTYEVRARPGQAIVLHQYASLVPGSMHHQPERQAVRLLALSRRRGFARLRRENADAWAEIWKGRPVVLGAEARWQTLIDAAFFYLQSSVHPSSLASTHIFGLAQWYDYHYYYGHVMWDIESFALPPLLLTQPDAAHAMLAFRTRGIEAAQQNAMLYGYRGVQFPWEASAARAEEAAPGSGTASAYEHHVSLDVALAFARYAHATGDERFAAEQAWPVLAGVSDWLATRVTRSGRGYELRDVMGIAEREQPSDNVAFVSMSAVVVLRETIALARRLGRPCARAWADIAQRLVVPIDEHGVILDHDGYDPDEEKGATPAAMAGLFPVGYEVPGTVEAATTTFYLALADAYIGSPMLSALYGAWAARLGERDRALELLEDGYAAFVDDRFLNVHEYRSDRFPEQPVAGPFYANIGGFLTGIYYGFTGLQLGDGPPSSWCARPVSLPRGWEAITIDRVWARGEPMRLVAQQGAERAELAATED